MTSSLAKVLALVAAAARRLTRGPRSRAAITGVIVLYETPMPSDVISRTPALTVRGARDGIERFLTLAEFQDLFGGYIIWSRSNHPSEEIPGEALGVWGRRNCERLRRVLRERGAVVENRREPGPAQSIKTYSA